MGTKEIIDAAEEALIWTMITIIIVVLVAVFIVWLVIGPPPRPPKCDD